MACRQYAGSQQAEAASNFSYNSINTSHSCISSFGASCDSSVQQHISDSSGYHNSGDTMGCFSSSGNWQCEGDLTLADILSMSVPGALHSQGISLPGQAIGQTQSCQPNWGPQQGAPLPAVEASCVGALPHASETMASLQCLQQQPARGVAAYNTVAGCLSGAATEQHLLQQLMQQVESVTAMSSVSAASDTVPAALSLGGGQRMLSTLVPQANQPLVAAPATGTSLAMSASDHLQLEWLQQRNALLQQQLVQQQELVQEQQRQQERLQQQMQLQLLLQQQQQQGNMQQPGNCTWPSDVDLLAAAFPDLNISSSNEHNRQAAASTHGDTALLLRKLPADVGDASGTSPLVALDNSRGAGSLPGPNSAFAAGVRSPDGAAPLCAGLPARQQAPCTVRDQVVLHVGPKAPASATVSAVQPVAWAGNSLPSAAPASYIMLSTHQQQQQPVLQQQQQLIEHSSGSSQTVGTGVFIRGVAAGTMVPAEPSDSFSQQSTVSSAAAQGTAGRVSSGGRVSSPAGTGAAGAAGVSSSTSQPQSDQLSKSRSFDGTSTLSSPLTTSGSEVRRINSSRWRHSFDSAKFAVNRSTGQQGSAGTAPAAGADSSQHSSDGAGTSCRRSLPGRPGKGNSPIHRCAPKWAPQNWDPKAQVAELGAATHKGTGAFIPGAMRTTPSAEALDQVGAK